MPEKEKKESFPMWQKGMRTSKKVLHKENGVQLLDEDGNPAYKTVRVEIPVTEKSIMNHLHASNQVRKHTQTLWNQVNECPYFRQPITRKICKKTGKPLPYRKKGRESITTRTNRALSGHTMRTLFSGAFATVGAQLDADAKMLRLETEAEDPKFPYLPSFSMAASYAIEAAYIAYVQEVFHTALEIRRAAKKHTKVTAKCCQAAAEIVNKRISSATSFVPEVVSLRKINKSVGKKAAPAGAKA